MRRKLRLVAVVLSVLVSIAVAFSLYEVMRTIRVTERIAAVKPADAYELPYLVERLHDYNFMIRAKAAGALTRLGPAAKPAYSDLLAAMKDPSAQVRANATAAFIQIGDANCIPDLIARLDDEDNEVRRYAACALRDNGKHAAAAVPRLIELLDDEWMGCWAAAALGEIGPAAKPAIPKLIAAMSSAHDLRRLEYIVAIEKFGNDGKDALPQLRKLTTDPDPLINQAAAKAIRTISTPPPAY